MKRTIKSLTKTFTKTQHLTFTLVLLSGSALYASDNWSLQPAIKQTGSYQSNPLMLSGKHKSLYGSTTTPSLTFSTATPTTKLSAFANVDYGIFNLSDFNSTDFHGGVTLDRSLERWGAAISGNADYDTTRTSELTTFNNTAIGSVRHFGKSVTPTIYFKPSALDKISVSGSVSQSNYDNRIFTDYHIFSVTLTYEYNITPLHSVSLALPAQRYQTDNNSTKNRTDSYAPTLGWVGHISPTVTANASIGSRHYSDSGPGIVPDKWKWKSIYSAGLDFKGETDQLNLTAKRDLQPYANGSQAFLNSILLSDAHTINPLFTVNAGGGYQYSAIDKGPSVALKSLKSANAGLTYHATELVDISATYQYREQALINVSGKQQDSQAMLSLTYRPVLSFLDNK